MFVVPGATHSPVDGGVAFSGSGGGAVSLLNALLPIPLLLLRAAGAGIDSWQMGSVNGAPNLIPNISVSAAETETVDPMVSRTTIELAAAVRRIEL
jgi:hypothetical protein